MAKIKHNILGGLVYSTDPDFISVKNLQHEAVTLPTAEQKLKVRLDTKNRAGKAVTIIEGFIGSLLHKEELGKKLKTFCGTGGSVKDNEIIVQGDNREKILQWLQKNRYSSSKKI